MLEMLNDILVLLLLQIISHRDKPEVTPTKEQKFPFISFCPHICCGAVVLYLLELERTFAKIEVSQSRRRSLLGLSHLSQKTLC